MPGNWTHLKIALRLIAVGVVLSLGKTPLHAQSNAPPPVWQPNEDPAGTAGVLRDQVETGGGYNAHNGNAHRAVTDLKVPGALGAYGLDFTRHWNSTDASLGGTERLGAGPFGYGGWTHSWNWIARKDDQIWECNPEIGLCNNYRTDTYIIEVSYPDGHTSKFSFARTDGYDINGHYSAEAHGYPWPEQFAGHPSLTDHVRGMDPHGNFFWLHLSDGGAVYFERAGDWSYRATRVLDPNGYQTTLTYQGASLDRVTGHDGRYLQFEWQNLADSTRVIASVQTGTGQRVEYCYAAYTLPGSGNLVPGRPDDLVQYAVTKAKYMDEIDPSTNQPVQAKYTYTAHVARDPDPTTGEPNMGPIRGMGPLLMEADDPRIEGPMTKIRYVFRGGPGGSPMYPLAGDNPQGVSNIDFFHMVAFPIEAELSVETGFLISALGIPPNADPRTHPDVGTRTEVRGAGGSRKFYYGSTCGIEPGGTYTPGNNGSGYFTPPEAATGGYRPWELGKITQFSDNPATAHFEFQRHERHTPGIDGRPWRIFDGRGTLTQLAWVPWSGRVSGLWNRGSDGSTRFYNWTAPGNSEARDPSRIPNVYNHWLFSQTDERGHTITYIRDSRRRVTRIVYPGGSEEAFTYNGFNQITNHTLPSGAVKSFEYDTRGLLKREWNSVDGGYANGTIYTHDALDRVETISHAWSRAKSAPFSVKMTYNARHQVLTEEYPPTNGVPQPTKEYRYDRYGNCTGIKNERGAWSSYTYDEYRRCTSFTEPLNAPNWNNTGTVASRTWNWIYDRWYQPPGSNGVLLDASTHTSKQWRVQIEPAFNAANDRRLSARKFDYSDRIIEEVTGMIRAATTGNYEGTADTEVRTYSYDENGNKKSFTDALGRVTDYIHNRRDFLTKITEYPDPTIAGAPRITEMDYDTTGNKTLVKFPDLKTQQWLDHDSFGQPARFIDERGNTTNLYYDWGPMKKLGWVITHRTKDGGGIEDQATRFLYDGMGRKQWILYPNGTSELWDYGLLGQLKAFKTRGGQTKRIEYDARGREDNHAWDGNAAPGIDRTWDDANRLTAISNIFSTIDYKYDEAGQVWREGNDIKGSGVRAQMDFYRYPSGEVGTLKYPNGIALRKVYTARGQLKTIGFHTSADRLVDYYYRPDGKVNYSTYWNGVSTTNYGYDGRGMIGSIHHVRTAFGLQGNLGYRGYWRDARDRIWAWQRGMDNTINGKEVGNGTKFQYDGEGQVTDAWYLAQDPGGNMANPVAQEHFNYDQLGNRTGENVLYPSGTRSFTGKDTGLNQYRAWWPYSIINYDDDVTWPANGVLMQEGNITAGFNALNQPMFITGTAYNGTSNWMHFGFDPLGRCVKRWVGPLSASGWTPPPETNPATYFYYDGWNIAQEGPGGGVVSRTYAHGARVDEIIASSDQTGVVYFHHYDALGNCILTSDGAGVLREQYDYQAFGTPYFYNPAGTNIFSSPWGNRFLFKGREWLSDLKLYDNRHRLYQPELGRFLQPDPKHFAGGDYNLYRYCHNDPVNNTDPFGLEIGYSFADPSNQAAMEAHLVRLERMGGEIASTVKQLRDSPNKIVFGDIQRNVAGWDKNNLPPRDPKDNTFRTTPRNEEKSRNGEGTGSYVEINPKDWNSAGGKRDPVEGAGHEVRHAAANDKGNRLSGKAEEKRAQQFQLLIRKKIQEGK